MIVLWVVGLGCKRVYIYWSYCKVVCGPGVYIYLPAYGGSGCAFPVLKTALYSYIASPPPDAVIY